MLFSYNTHIHFVANKGLRLNCHSKDVYKTDAILSSCHFSMKDHIVNRDASLNRDGSYNRANP